MKIAIISDIHGNLPALQTVLAETAAGGVNSAINSGDTLCDPLAAACAAELLMARQMLKLPTRKLSASDARALAELSDE